MKTYTFALRLFTIIIVLVIGTNRLYAQTASATINYTGAISFGCCSGYSSDYYCIDNTGGCGTTSTCLTENFTDPIPAGNIATSVVIQFYTVRVGTASITASIDGNAFPAVNDISGGACSNSAYALTTSTSNSYNICSGMPGYIYGGSNTLQLCVTAEFCIQKAVIVITYSPGISATASNNGPICTGNVTLTGGPSGMSSYSWSGPSGYTSTSQSPVLSPAVAGTYTLTTSNSNACTATASTTVVLNGAPTPSPVYANNSNPLTICTGTPVNLNATSSGNTINWYNGSTLIGNYGSGANCPVTPTTTTTYNAQSLSAGISSGSQTFNYTGAVQTFTVPAGITSIGVDVAGAQGNSNTYNSVAGALGGRVQATIPVTAGEVLDIYVGSGAGVGTTGGYNGGGTGGVATYSSSSGGGGGGASDIRRTPYTYNSTYVLVSAGGGGGAGGERIASQSPGAGGGGGGGWYGGGGGGAYQGTGGGGGTPSAGGAAGIYGFTCCSGTAGAQQTGGAGGTVATSNQTGTNIGAAGGVGGGTTAGPGTTGASWAGGGGGGGSSFTNTTASGVTHTQGYRSGNGYVTISWTGTPSCTSTTVPVVVNVSSQPTATAGGSQTICPNGSATVSGASATNGTISWTSNGNGNITNSTTTTPTYNSVAADAGTTVTLTMTVTNSPCTPATATYSVYVSASPTVSITGSSSICVGGTTTLSPTSGGTWVSNSPSVASVTNAGVVTGLSSGSATFTFTSSSNCSSTTGAVTVTALPLVSITGSNSICVGGTTTLSPTSGGTWVSNSPGVASVTNAGVVTGLTAGISTFTYTSSTSPNCSNTTGTITVNPLPIATASSNSPVCAGSALNLTGGPAGMSSYTWSGPLGYTSNLQSPTVSVSATAGMAGTYTVTVTNSSSCVSTASTTVLVNPLPVDPTTATVDHNNFCPSAYPNITLSVTGGSGTTLNWSTSCGGASIGTGTPLTITSPTTTTTYYASWTNGCGTSGCASIAVVISSSATPPTTATASNNSFCIGTVPNITLTSTGGSGTTLNWSTSCGGASIGTNTPLTISSPTTTTTYYASWVDACGTSGCVSTTVTVNPIPVIPASASASTNTFCQGTVPNITLSVTGGSGTTLNWYTSCGGTAIGTGTPITIISPTTSTTYYASWANGCGTSGCVNTAVTVNPLPTVYNLSGSVSGGGSYCSGGSGVPVDLSGSQTGVSYQLQLNGVNTGSPVAGTGGIIGFGNQTAAGVYTVIATTSLGCSTPMGNTLTVTILPLPVATAGNNGPICVGSTLSLTSTPASMTTYAWSGPLSYTSAVQSPTVSASATAAMAGTYTVTVTNSNGCSNTATTNVVVNTNPVATASSNTPVCTGQTLNLLSSGGTTYHWSGPGSYTSTAQNPSIAGLTAAAAGVYTVTVTAVGGCSSTATTTVVVNTTPVATATSNSPVCVGSALNLTGGPAGMSGYSWSGPLAYTSTLQSPVVSSSATAGMAGTYTITVTSSSNCTSTASTTVVVNALPVATATNNGPVCSGNTLSLVAGPAGMTSYSWSGPLGYTSTVQNPVVSGSATTAMAGTYTVTVTNSNGCHNTASTTVVVNASPVATANNNGPICAGASLSLTGTPSGMTSYSWSGPLAYTSTIQNPTVSASATTAMSGIYTVTETNSNGCIGTASTTVTVNALPTAYTVTGGGAYCSGGTGVQVCLSGSTVGVSYQLQLFGVNTGTPVIGTGSSICFPLQTTAGTYTVIATNSSSCQSPMTGSVTITINPNPVANAGTTVTIPYGTYTTLSGSATGGMPSYTYSWSPGGSLINPNIQNPTTTNLTVTTTYTLTVTDANGCTSSATVTVVIAGSAITATASTTHTSICTGSTDQLSSTASGGTGVYTYSWSSVPAGFASTLQNPGIAPTTTTTYIVTVSDGYNTATSSVVVTVNPLPTASAGSNVSICQGANTTLNATGGTTYSWSPASGLSSTNVNNPVANPTTNITYVVTVTNSNGCSATAGVNINVFTVVPANAGADQTICNGQSAYLNAIGGISYSWSPATGLSSTIISDPVATPSISATYVVMTTDVNGCTSSDNVIVNVNPSVVATAGSNVTICQGDNTTLTATGGTIYSWSPAYGLSNASISNPVATPLYTTHYVVTVTNAGGCSATAGVTVTVNTTPVATVGPDVTICSGTNTTLTSSGGTTYNWSPGTGLSSTSINNPVANPPTTETYTVVVSNTSGCSATAAVVVNVNPLPLASAGTSVNLCNHSTEVLTATGGTNYQWSNGVNTAVNPVSPSTTTTYTVTVTDINGCSATSNVTVTVLPYAVPVITASGPITFCNGAPVNVTLNAGTGYSSYDWSNMATTQTINVTTPGYYYVIGYYTDGCHDTSRVVHVASYPAYPPPVITANGPIDFCEGDTISVDLTTNFPSNYIYSWSSGSTTPTIHVNHADYYWVTVTDTNGCTSYSDTLHVEFLPAPTAYMNYIQSGTHVTFVNNSLNGTTYLWYFGDGASSTLENPTHNYPALVTYHVIFIVSDSCGSDTMKATITLVSGQGIDEHSIVQNLEVYPIPTKDLLYVSFDFTGSKAIELKIANTLGQLLYNESEADYTGKYHKVLDLSLYPKGIYYLRIQTDKGTVNRKIIVN